MPRESPIRSWLVRGLATSAAALAPTLALAAPAGASTPTTTMASVASDGTHANGYSLGARISGNGAAVAFLSRADNLAAGDTNHANDVYVRDGSATERASLLPGGEPSANAADPPTISDDARFVAYSIFGQAFVRDRQTGDVERVDVSSDGTGGDGSSLSVLISGDGRYVAFASSSANLVADDPNGSSYSVFLHDRVTGSTKLVSGAAYAPAPGAISDDGHYVAFSTGTPFSGGQVQVWDRETGTA